MNEIELFVSLLNEKEADKILKAFNENIPGKRRNVASLNDKKRYITRIFQSRTPKMMQARRRNKPDPFYYYLNRYPKELIEGLDFKESVIKLKELSEKIPDFIRFGILLLNHPDEVREKLELIESNYKEGKDPIDLYEFETEKELKNYIEKSYGLDLTDQIENFIKELIQILTKKERKHFNELNKILQDYSFLDYYNKINELNKEYPLYILNLSYIKVHTNEDMRIKLLLLFEAMEILFEKYGPEKINKIKLNFLSRLKEKEELVEKLEKSTDEVQSRIDNQQKTIKELRKKESSYKEYIQQLEEEVEEIKDLELQINELQKTIAEKEKMYQRQVKERSDYIRKEYEDKIQKMENKYNKYIHLDELLNINANKASDDQAIILVEEFSLLKDIFPENIIIFDHEGEKLKQIIENDNMKEVFIIDYRMLSKNYINIMSKLEKAKKKYYPITGIKSFQECINFIGYLNYRKRKGSENEDLSGTCY